MEILVTGATSGFGASIARCFPEAGHVAIVTGRREDRLFELQREFGPELVHVVRLDVRRREQVNTAIEALPEGFAEIDLLVNNAGLALGTGPAQEVDLDAWNAMVDTNIKGVMYLTRAVLPGMVARDRGHDLLGTRVRISEIEPGMVKDTDFCSVRFGGGAEKAEKVYAGTDALTAKDIAEAVFWMASLRSHVNVNAIEQMAVLATSP